jgi:hypothetical protein
MPWLGNRNTALGYSFMNIGLELLLRDSRL